jgi:hypothetical protein
VRLGEPNRITVEPAAESMRCPAPDLAPGIQDRHVDKARADMLLGAEVDRLALKPTTRALGGGMIVDSRRVSGMRCLRA